MKYKNQEKVGAFLGEWYGEIIKKNRFIDNIDLVIPVPLHPKKLRKRGYNQVTQFGLQLATHLGAEFRSDVLLKTSNSRTQTKKGRLARWFDNKSLYTLSNTGIIEDKNILLVDDIITTGATIEMCAKALHESKNVNVFVASMAFVPLLYK
ncbi:ComF family protein [Aurantibacter crassamenti]|uniref:ComF family protein n=1 Tax=Aurantibacter crassamenti TaxID=1837375 RepID=UPI001EED0B17|nr:phosphoribosyltransferase family protein [Aurantibacter crassamenti]